MKKLDIEVIKNNLVYKQVKRTDVVAMYSVHLKSFSKDDVEMPVTGYEVFKIKRADEPVKTPWGTTIERGEIFPGNYAFGYTAWSYLKFDKANQKYNDLIKGNMNQNENRRNFNIDDGYTVIAYKKGCVVVMKDKKLCSNQKGFCQQACLKYTKLSKNQIEKMSIKQMVGVLFEN